MESLAEASRTFTYFSTETTGSASFHVSTFLAKGLAHDVVLLGLFRGNQVIVFISDASVDDDRFELVNARLFLGGDVEVVTDHASSGLGFQQTIVTFLSHLLDSVLLREHMQD